MHDHRRCCATGDGLRATGNIDVEPAYDLRGCDHHVRARPPGSTEGSGRRIRAQGMFVVPHSVSTTRSPYLGFVARAVEQDFSSSGDCAGDSTRFFTAIETAAQTIIDESRTPTPDELWLAGSPARLTDRFFQDDDDKVSTSVRALNGEYLT